MLLRLFLLRLLRRWHARIGFSAMLFFLILAVTGLVLNHGAWLGFDGRYVHAGWLARWYGIQSEAPREAFRSAHHVLGGAECLARSFGLDAIPARKPAGVNVAAVEPQPRTVIQDQARDGENQKKQHC